LGHIMGDNINIDYSHAGYVPDFGNALMQGFNSGRQMTIDRATDQARANAAANPDDLDAITHLAVYDQNAAKAYADRISMQRAASFRQAAGSYIGQNFPTSGQNAFAPQSSSVAQSQNAPPMAGPPNALAPQPSAPIAPGGQPGFADAMGSAMQGIPGAPPAPPQPQAGGMAPQGAPQPQQAQQTPLANPQHPVNVEAGQAVSQGQPFNALAAMYQADPDGADKMVTAVSNLDKLRRDKLGESSGAIGSEAQALLNVPLQNRASELQRIAPMLLQHGVTPQQIQSAIQGGLSDNLLHGLIGQATTVQQAIDQSNKLVEQGVQDRTATTAENAQSETVRHNRMDENQGVVVQNASGGSNLVRRNDGSVIYNGSGAAGAGDINDKIAAAEGTGRNPNSSASGIGQFTNATYLTTFKQAFPDKANLSDAQILSTRGSGVEGKMLQTLTSNNQAILQGAGVAPTDGNTYLAHFLGAGGAIRVAKADPSAPLSGVVSPAAIAANPFLKGMTAGDVQNWANQKMASGGTTGGGAGGWTADAIDQQARLGIIENGGKPPTGLSRNKAVQGAISNRIAEIMHNGGISTTDAIAGAADVKSSQTSLGTLQKQATIINSAENAARANGNLALSLAPAVGNGSIPIFNAWKNAAGRNTGDANISKFNASIETFANEYATVMARGGVTSDTLRSHAHDMLNSSQSPAQFSGTMQTLFQDMANRRAGLEQERQATLNHIRTAFATPSGATHYPTDITSLIKRYKN
jgi:hypothetical protein